MASSAVRRYWSRVAALGCVVCGGPAEIAHCHGGSIVERMQEPKAKGKKLARLNWLVIPLCPTHHRLGTISLDNHRELWEARYGLQADYIDAMCSKFGIDLWAKANEGRK